MSNRDNKLSEQIILALCGSLWTPNADHAVEDVNNIPLPVIPFKPANRKPIAIVGSFTSGGTPSSQQLYTVPDGKVLRICAWAISCGQSGGVILIRDGIVDSGTEIIDTHAGNTGPQNMAVDPDYAIIVENGLRVDAAGQYASTSYRMSFYGWLEDKETSAPATVENF